MLNILSINEIHAFQHYLCRVMLRILLEMENT